MTDAKTQIHQLDPHQCRTAQAVKFDTGEFGTRDEEGIASTRKGGNTRERVAQKGVRERMPSGNKHGTKRTLGIPNVKSPRSRVKTRSGLDANSTNRMKK